MNHLRQPRLGAWPVPEGVRFRVWAPGRRTVRLLLERNDRPLGEHILQPERDGWFGGLAPEARAGDRYRYRLDDDGPFPDPASRWQPQGVHGPSAIVDPGRFRWSDEAWSGPDPDRLVLYELHVGSFTPEGTFRAAAGRLEHLRDLGVTAVELMPVADFPGRRNWGYDGASLFAPAGCYGPPDDLRELVNHAHRLGLGMVLDVVYNHLGPDGSWLPVFAPAVLSPREHTPWGAAVNLDGPGSGVVREFLIENALHWLSEYHLDGLRLDAIHTLVDRSPRHLMADLATRVREQIGPKVLLFAEDNRNLAEIARPVSSGGWGFDAIWSDDFHHAVRRGLAGDRDGYFVDFEGSTSEIVRTIRRGWLYDGVHSEYFGRPRGTDPGGLPPHAFVLYLQNHDQTGNRARGERLHHQVDASTWRAATVLLLLAPETPLLFMGQEWAASTPFLYFTDHEPELGRRITAGRRAEFRRFAGFGDPGARQSVPDPQAEATFLASRLDWNERLREPHAAVLRLTRALLRIRHELLSRYRRSWSGFSANAVGDDGLLLDYGGGESRLTVALQLRGRGTLRVGSTGAAAVGPLVLLTTEDPGFTADSAPPRLKDEAGFTTVEFFRPGAAVLQWPGPPQ